jgi:Mechanosensitive ion channel
MWINSRPLCKALLKKFKLRGACYVLLVAVLTAEISAQVSPPAPDLPSDQQVLAFLTESIDWYRHRAVEEQLATEPVDLVFLEDNRPVAAQIMQLSFDFARADASLAATFQGGKQKASAAVASGSSPHLAHFVQLESNADSASRQADQEVETIKNKLVTARGAERRTLQAALDVTQRRLDLLQAGAASLRELVEFVQATGGRQSDLASSIEDLAGTVPEVTNPTTVRPRTQNSELASLAKPRDSGILGLSSEVSALGRKLRILDDEIGRTDKLRQSSDDVRKPLLAYVNKRFPMSSNNYLQASDLRALQQQKAELDALIAVAKPLAPAMVALDKQNVLLDSYISHLKTWRASVVNENAKTWRSLILRVVGVAVVFGALLLIGAAARSLTDRHVRDAKRRHVIRVIERVVPWVMIVLVAALSFTSDLTSLATFFGLLTAGVAIALQSVILSALGYFLLVGKRGIRVGDRVQISGVTGNVIDIGWLQFRVQEIDNETQQPTGHVVTFSNSFVFVSPATGLSKSNPEDVKPAQLEVVGKTPQL